MKTTIDIADELLRSAKALAERKKTTLKDIVESALRAYLQMPSPQRRVQVTPVVVQGDPADAALLTELLRERGNMDRPVRENIRRRKGAA